MIQGTVTAAREAIVRVHVRDPGGRNVEIDAVVDTGFNDELTMPPALIAELGLAFQAPAEVTLAGNITVPTDYYRVTVIWDGRQRPVSVLEIEGSPLVGMGLLWQHRMTLEATRGGAVRVERLSIREGDGEAC